MVFIFTDFIRVTVKKGAVILYALFRLANRACLRTIHTLFIVRLAYFLLLSLSRKSTLLYILAFAVLYSTTFQVEYRILELDLDIRQTQILEGLSNIHHLQMPHQLDNLFPRPHLGASTNTHLDDPVWQINKLKRYYFNIKLRNN